MTGQALDIGSRLETAIAHLERLVAFPTVSLTSNLDLVDWASEILSASGARLVRTTTPCGTRANIFATLGPEGDDGIVLSGHTDVVPADAAEWSSDPFVLRQEGDSLHGRGTCDMKGFLACCLAMVPLFARQDLTRPLHFALTHDEEVGCFGAQDLVTHLEANGPRPAIAIIGEPTEMGMVDGHKGTHEYTTRFHGRAGHGSDPDGGANAIHAAALFIAELLRVGEDLKARAPATSPYTPPWTTVQAGTINGGTARNIIAAEAVVEWEMRPISDADEAFVKARMADHVDTTLLPLLRWSALEYIPEERRHSEERKSGQIKERGQHQVHAAHQSSRGATIATEIVAEVRGLVPTDPNPARDLVANLTGANGATVVPFGTEAGLFQGLGTAAVVCGPGSIQQAHTADEFITVDQMRRCLAMLERLGEHLDASH
ncbi:MAG: acetylornithine deacetylase [Pseudomonadota bacterium]